MPDHELFESLTNSAADSVIHLAAQENNLEVARISRLQHMQQVHVG